MPDRLNKPSLPATHPVPGETPAPTDRWSQVGVQAAHVISHIRESGVVLDSILTALTRYQLMAHYATSLTDTNKWDFRKQILDEFNLYAQNRTAQGQQRQAAKRQAEHLASDLFAIFRDNPNPNHDHLKNVINAIINPRQP